MTNGGINMTQKNVIWDKVDEYKYAIMYYVYFATCLVVALILAQPSKILASIF